MKGEMTMTIKGDRAKIDIGADSTTIINQSTKDTISMMHAQKMIMKISGAQIKAQIDQAEKGAESALKPTGEKEKIGEYDCEIYLFSASGTTTKMWIAKNYPNFAAIKDEMKKVMTQGDDSIKVDLPGMIVKSVVDVGGQKVTTTLVSVKSENVDESVFATPAGYQEMKMPGSGQ